MSENASMQQKVGRPRDAKKREAILDSAWAQFLTNGVETTSLIEIAKHAGVTRVTLYSHFSDKAALFEATVEREMARLAATQLKTKPDGHLRQILIEYGTALMGFLTSPGPINYYNVLAGELRRHPDLARRFYENGPAISVKNLAIILKRADAKNEVAIDSPERAAEQLIGLWQGVSNYKLALGLDIGQQIKATPQKVADGVDVFLRAYNVKSMHP